MYADSTADCIGACEAPMLLVKEKFGRLEKGQVLKVETDKPAVVRDVEDWAGNLGFSIEEQEKVAGVTSIWIRKTKEWSEEIEPTMQTAEQQR
ncbi:sulfurtransferase TusA family protein [Methanoculleus sp. FWC-SCC1]|uniref:Sulfurtransferase TusA family protein n=1 Tax=Methanoculleus frigidifontis TaxID=2584085 RepID=A0ABT8MDV4_9EURY|nr:sulfurtransferase TusA family protein [Methanoculleus sp. FWC-SCC1]MDN7026119.1 sulfurtransferase TusA family protein [Methanoculleus sp. FWC-SCC1]